MTRTRTRAVDRKSPDRRAKPVDEWPALDRCLWLAALSPGDLLDDGGALSRYSQPTVGKVAAGYGRWLTWLDICGLLDQTATPADRITPARVGDYVEALARRENASATIVSRLIELMSAARILAPDRNWSWISQFAVRV